MFVFVLSLPFMPVFDTQTCFKKRGGFSQRSRNEKMEEYSSVSSPSLLTAIKPPCKQCAKNIKIE